MNNLFLITFVFTIGLLISSGVAQTQNFVWCPLSDSSCSTVVITSSVLDQSITTAKSEQTTELGIIDKVKNRIGELFGDVKFVGLQGILEPIQTLGRAFTVFVNFLRALWNIIVVAVTITLVEILDRGVKIPINLGAIAGRGGVKVTSKAKETEAGEITGFRLSPTVRIGGLRSFIVTKGIGYHLVQIAKNVAYLMLFIALINALVDTSFLFEDPINKLITGGS
ncbi:MAG: hypothetical protein QXO57_02565 [Candidatus Aenigmatarchaeota archaeon]